LNAAADLSNVAAMAKAAAKAKPKKPATSAKQPAGDKAAGFAGFAGDAMGFWHELSLQMSREWFAENKARYEAAWVAPMTALMQGVRDRLVPVYGPMKIGEPNIMRIYRDVRFSKDKTPYKTHIAGVIRPAGKPAAKIGTAVLYLHLGLEEEYVGVGSYQFDPAKLVKWRKLVAGKGGEEIQRLIEKLRKAGYDVHSYEQYKKVPAGFAADHPRAELLTYKGLTCGFPEIPRGLITKPGFADWVFEHAKATAPLVSWLHRNLG